MRFRLAGVTAISVALALVTAYARVPQGRGGGGIPVPQVTPVPQSGQSQSGPLPPPLVATGLVVGRVIDATSGEPVAGAVVMMSGGPSRMPPVPSAPGRAAQTPPPPPPPPPRVLTDSEGRFAFRNVTRGTYALTVSKNGYLGGGYGRNRPDGPGKSLQLDDNERVADAVIRIFKYAAITGRIIDEAGEPIVGAQVRAYRRVLQSGRRTFREANSVATDDRGIYRLSSLSPGDYVVCAPMTSVTAPGARMSPGVEANYSSTMTSVTSAPPGAGGAGRQITSDSGFVLQSDANAVTIDASGRWRGYATQYFPAARSITQGEVISLGSGTERTAVDIQMTYVPVRTISGTLTTPGSSPGSHVLRLVSADTMNMTTEPESATTMTDGTGAFAFYGVPSGQYTIQAIRAASNQQQSFEFSAASQSSDYSVQGGGRAGLQPMPPPSPLLWAAVPVAVGESDVAGVVVALQEGFTISGRFEFTGTKPRPDPQRLTSVPVVVELADGREIGGFGGQAPSRTGTDGRFVTAARPPGKYLLRIGGSPAGFVVQSIAVNGVNVTDVPFDLTGSVTNAVVTFTDQIASVAGTVRGISPGDELPLVVLFPADTRGWKDYGLNPMRIKSTRPSSTGAFNFGSLVTGDYLAVAIADEFSSEWQDPAYLELIARGAERFSLTGGEKHSVTVDIARIKPPSIGREPSEVRFPRASVRNPVRSPRALARGSFLPADDVPPSALPEPSFSPTDAVETPDGGVLHQARDTRGAEPTGSSGISGTIMIDDNGVKPARLARVTVSGAGVTTRTALTDEAGRYSIPWLPPGDYQVQATKPAFLPMYYGAKRPVIGPGATVHVATGQSVTNINVTLPKGGVVSGAVYDDSGQPIAGVRVNLQTFARREGERVLVGVNSTGAPTASTTNDRGEFRFYGLRAGTYVALAQPGMVAVNQDLRQLSDNEMRAAVADAAKSPTPKSVLDSVRTIAPAPTLDSPVTPAPGRAISYSPVYYPGTVRPEEAAELTLALGQELNNINIQVRMVPASRVEGRVIGPDGQLAMNAQVSLLRFAGTGMSSSGVRVQNGAFVAVGIAAGRYVLSAQLDVPNGRGSATPANFYWAQLDLDLNGDDQTNLTLALGPLPTVTGRVVFEGDTPPSMAGVSIRLESAGQMLLQTIREVRPATPDATGAFTLVGVMPGRYRLNASVSPRSGEAPQPGVQPAAIPMMNATGWSVASASVGGQDAWVTPFEVHYGQSLADAELRFTNKPADLSGKLIDAANKPVPNMTVALFPTDRALWTLNSARVNRTSRSTAAGTFSFPLVVPGEYYLVVLTELDTNDWPEVDFKEQLVPAAIKVTIAKGEKKIQDMKIGGT
jgi:hypothetical protein